MPWIDTIIFYEPTWKVCHYQWRYPYYTCFLVCPQIRKLCETSAVTGLSEIWKYITRCYGLAWISYHDYTGYLIFLRKVPLASETLYDAGNPVLKSFPLPCSSVTFPFEIPDTIQLCILAGTINCSTVGFFLNIISFTVDACCRKSGTFALAGLLQNKVEQIFFIYW